jgi:CRP/FNR family cyclic AMP-dependent transcriptional regulator
MFMALEDTLAKVELFSELPTKDLQRIARLCVTKQFKKGDAIVREGELGIAFYVVSKGKVDVVANLGKANEQILVSHNPGGYFGEMALFDNQVRSASVRAAEDSECLVLTKWDFNAELNAPGSRIAVALLPVLARRVRNFTDAATH